MQVINEWCCGLDVHKLTVVACLLTPSGKEVRTFGTMTDELLGLADWLREAGCQHVAMESTGCYGKPIYNLLEASGMEVLVVNARHIKAVPGRKTDMKDAEWHPEGTRDLLRHGLLRGSFIPDRTQRELQELVRYRRSLIQERAREANRIQKVLEGANIKLGSVIRDVLGVSGRAMLKALIAGVDEPAAVVAQATTRLKATPEELKRAVQGRMGAHQRMLLQTQLTHVDFLEQQIAQLDTEIGERMRPFAEKLERLDAIPGVAERGAQEIIAAIGVDMSRFPSAAHVASWAKICPGNNESAGKRSSGKTGKGNPYLRTTLVEAALGASKKRDCYLAMQYWRLVGRKGKKRAALAVAHSILVIAYHILKDDTVYQELGADYHDERSKEAIKRKAIKQLERLNLKVTVEPAA